MVPTYVRPPPMFEKGEGCYMWDIENRKYLDLTAGIAVNALGHCDPGVAQVLGEQVRLQIIQLTTNTCQQTSRRSS
jgi:acetylornithine aminotransferase